MSRCSTNGPSASAGRKVRPPTTMITSTVRPMNSGVAVGKVPAESGSVFLLASRPATASIGSIVRKRPISMARPMVVLKNGVFALSPANAEPLLAVPELYA